MSKEPKRNVYVGHRYVPKIMGEWDKTESYEGLSIVTNKGTSYTSKKRVPVGIDILDEEYWVVTGNYNAQIEEYRKDVRELEKEVDKKADKTYVDSEIERLDQKDEDLTTQLAQKSKDIVDLRESKWGVKADDLTDDTVKFETALQYATDNGCKVILPNGTIKITRPVTILYHEKNGLPLTTPPLSFSMEGLGGVSFGILKNSASNIKAYNIPDGRSALELLGKNNGLASSVELKNLQITLDDATCGELSFCLTLGDSWLFTVNRVKLRGYNGVMLRNGSGIGANSYANISCKFEQVSIVTNRYVDWDGTTTTYKNRFGFAVAYERMFFDNGYTPYRSDSITYDTCFFGGTVINYAVQSVYTNCMWYIPGSFKPEVNISLDPRFNKKWFDVETIDNSIGFWNAGGSATLINPYFEDVPKCIFARSLAGMGNNNKIIQPFMLGNFNTPITINGESKSCVYGIKSVIPSGATPTISVEGGIYNKGNTGFSEGFLVNQASVIISVRGVNGVTSSDITDTVSRQRDIQYIGSVYEKELVVEYKGKANGGFLGVSGTDVKEYFLNNEYILNKVEVFVEGKLTSSGYLSLRFNNEEWLPIKGIGPKASTYDHVTQIQGTNSEMYIVDNIPYTPLPDFPLSKRKFRFPLGGLQVLLGGEYPSPDADISMTVKLYFAS